MRVFLIRHGHAEHNLAFDTVKQVSVYRSALYRNSALTVKGIAQCSTVWKPYIEKVYCSPLKRCIQTAHIIFGENRRLFLRDDLVETKGPYPCNHRLSLDDIICQNVNVDVDALDPDYVNSMVHETPGGLKARAISSFRSICKEAAADSVEHVAIVTHHDWIEALIGKSVPNASITEVKNPLEV